MAAHDLNTRSASTIGPARALRAVTPSDASDLPDGVSRSIYVGGAGNVAVVDALGNAVDLASAANQYHPIQVARVRATGTTASGILALY